VHAGDPVVCHKELRYGPAQRNLLDIYIPQVRTSSSVPSARAKKNGPFSGPQAAEQRPVVLFVHGGVWSTGERWQYGLLGDALASLGIVVCVMSYTLYPEALVDTMVSSTEPFQ
jgi:prenylcysteine alpha-carboxyl methylesterase